MPSLAYFVLGVLRTLRGPPELGDVALSPTHILDAEGLLFLTCSFGFLASSIFHTFNAHSEQVARACVRVDMIGIVLMLTANCSLIICECTHARLAFTRR